MVFFYSGFTTMDLQGNTVSRETLYMYFIIGSLYNS